MLDIFRAQNITWDIANRRVNQTLEASGGDANGRTLRVRITDGGEVIDLSATLSLAWRAGKNYGLDSFSSIGDGYYEIYYTTAMLAHETVKASFVLTTSGGVIESLPFHIKIADSLVDSDAIQNENSFTALTEALVQVNNLETTYTPRLNAVEDSVDSLQAFVGYTNDDIMGVEVDFKNKKFTRLAGAVNKTPGEMFDDVQAFGGRKRCILTDDGVVLAYHGEPGYTETGALTQAITIGVEPDAVTYPVGTVVQVMVEQPKFYYKVVPLQLDKVVDGKGFHMRKARYYVSDVKKTDFKLHPAFISNGKEKNFIYLSAYEGSVYDTSAEAYLLADEQIADFTVTTGDKLSSIAYAKPTSGVTQAGATRIGFRKLANNRGIGWEQAYAATVVATQLLFTIEYASMNTQTSIGMGNVDKPSGEGNESEITGATTNLGNESGSVENGSISYRGEENFWGNIWKWVDGLNIFNQSDLYVSDHGFTDDTGNDPYKDAGITAAKDTGYISAFGYNEEFDWLFFASETLGNSSLPVGDYLYQSTAGGAWRVARLGGGWVNGSQAGGFFWSVSAASSARYRDRGGRLVYVPDAA